MVFPLSCNYVLPVPEMAEQSQRSGSYSICLQDLQRAVPIQRVVRLSEVQKDLKKRDLLNGSQLLQKFGFNDGSAGTSTSAKTVKGIMEVYFLLETCIHDGRYQLPTDFQEANPTEITTTLGKEDHR
jgi:hypothetical protein